MCLLVTFRAFILSVAQYELCGFEDSTDMFWMNLQLIKVVQQGFLSSTELSVSRQARDKFLLGVAHFLCHTLWKSLCSRFQKIIGGI